VNRFGNAARHEGVRAERPDPKKVPVPPFLPDIPECREELAEYYQAVDRLDEGVGRLLETLRAAGRREDTVVLFLSDNGIAFPGAKTNLYEPGMRLPLIVRAPGSKRRGAASAAMVSWADITPTVLDLAGARPEGPRFHGRSFRAALEGEDPAGWDEVYGSHTFHEVTMYYPMRLVRGRRYKYILNLAHGLPFPFASDLWESATWQAFRERGLSHYGKRPAEAYLHRPRHELYDLEADPHETRNLAADPEHRKVLEELQAKLKAWQESTGDPWRSKYVYE
jgi:N-sulfoglucosamine sulfohydrolase